MAGLLKRIFSSPVRAAGDTSVPAVTKANGGPWYLPFSGGFLPSDVGQHWNWWQMGYDPVPAGTSAMVEACVSAYSQTIAMCPGDHWRALPNGGRERVTNSALTRILRKPNEYQSISDFMLNSVRSLYKTGESVAVALRNDRFEVTSLHLVDKRQAFPVVTEDGSIFYRLGGNTVLSELLPSPIIVPDRDVLHIRLHTDADDPLVGHSPIEAVAMDVLASGAMSQQQIAFYLNQARPSFVLGTEQPLTLEQANELRALWDAQSQGLAAGKTPILTRGLKPLPLSTSSRDAQLADMMKLTDERIALAFRIPLQIFGLGGTPFASTEALMQSWRASGLGFALNHIEEAWGLFFRLRGQPDEYVEFNTAALLRSVFGERVGALAAAIKGSILSTDEARAELEYGKVPHGKYVRGQAQDVPLGPPPPDPVPGQIAPFGGGGPITPPDPEDLEENDGDEEGLSQAAIQDLVTSSLTALVRFDPSQPRDPGGKWTSGGGSGGSSSSSEGGDDPASTTPKGKAPRSVSELHSANYRPVTPQEIISARPPETRQKIEAAISRLEAIVPTDAPVSKGGHRDAQGRWTSERAALHDRIIDAVFSAERVAAATPSEGAAPLLTMLGGRGGSGKGTLLRDGTIDTARALKFDSDEFKAMLPEYEGWNSAQVHEEANDIMNRAINVARRARLNVVVDATMSSDSAVRRLAEFRASGYRAEGHYVYVSPETSASRAIDRFERGGDKGRYVPLDYLLANSGNEARFDRMRSSFDEWHVYDNNTAGAKPRRVISGKGRTYAPNQRKNPRRAPHREYRGRALSLT
jgi:HK97 family phage portal protein